MPYHNYNVYTIKRDNMNCELCGAKKAVTHHIDGNRENNSFDNLVLLCVTCHIKIHRFQNSIELKKTLEQLVQIKLAINKKIGNSKKIWENCINKRKSYRAWIDTRLYILLKEISEHYNISIVSASNFLLHKIKEENIDFYDILTNNKKVE